MLARNIPGNAAVVTHQVTGLLFADAQVRGALSPPPHVGFPPVWRALHPAASRSPQCVACAAPCRKEARSSDLHCPGAAYLQGLQLLTPEPDLRGAVLYSGSICQLLGHTHVLTSTPESKVRVCREARVGVRKETRAV